MCIICVNNSNPKIMMCLIHGQPQIKHSLANIPLVPKLYIMPKQHNWRMTIPKVEKPKLMNDHC